MSMGIKYEYNTQKIIKDFSDLFAWQESHKLVLFVYKLAKKFPEDEKFGLTSQIKRAVVSVTSNIAEGFGRNTKKDKTQFYAIAKGSLYETDNQLKIALDLGYVSESDYKIAKENIYKCLRLISGLAKSAFDCKPL
ncbi:MAG: four helix bundle protein [Candidatus Taylorbacteria bacterium]|nr:four helix bundle protein [Candidatus Taylorbacteria bacterium]